MIRIQRGPAPIRQMIAEADPTWLGRADNAAARNVEARKHIDKPRLCSSIKGLWIRMQREKCAYCERQLGAAGVEWDIEHFRPKGVVDAWVAAPPGIEDSGGDAPSGYFLLAYNPENFLVSCRTCNQVYKGAYFPTARRRNLSSVNADDLRGELPYLINPLDPADPDPMDMIKFHGAFARAVDGDVDNRRRALATIALLALNREELVKERIGVIIGLAGSLELAAASQSPEVQQVALRSADGYCADDQPHASCARAFRSLWSEDVVAARRVYDQASRLRKKDP